jgi:hypothetical protein
MDNHKLDGLFWTSVLAFAALIPSAHASAIVDLNPLDGVVSGTPGSTVGWGFGMTAGAYWVEVTSVSISGETSPLGGMSGGFTSYMDLLGGSVDGATPPGQNWALPFVPGSPGSGLGQYVIDPTTGLGTQDTGNLVITYDEFSNDPNTCSSCYVDTLQMLTSDSTVPSFTINVETPTSAPEPTAFAVCLIGLLALKVTRKAKQR